MQATKSKDDTSTLLNLANNALPTISEGTRRSMLTKLAKKLNESANENSKEDTDVRSDGRTETTVDRDKVDSAASKKRQDRTKFLRKKYHRMEASSNLKLENGLIDP